MEKKINRRIVVIMLILLIAFCFSGFYQVNNSSIGKTIENKLNIICNNPKMKLSSNPYDYTKNSRSYSDIVKLGKPALNYMLEEFKNSEVNGLKQYIMAIASSEILKEDPRKKTWETGREWFNNYRIAHSTKVTLSKAEKLIGLKPLKEFTKDDFWSKLGVQIFKYKESKNSCVYTYMIKNNKVTNLGYTSGNIDTPNVCLSDLNNDRLPELLYFNCMGSGLNITRFFCIDQDKLITAKFSSIQFVGFKFIKTDLQNIKLGVWYPDIQDSDKDSQALGKLYFKNKIFGIKMYDQLTKEMKNYINITK